MRWPAILLCCVFVVACTSDDAEPTPSPTRTARATECSTDLPFGATFVPEGIAGTPKVGPGGGASVPPQMAVVHYEGPQGTFIDVYRGSGHYVTAEPQTIRVLAGDGQLGIVEDGYGADFTYGGASKCDRYHVEAFGVDEADVVRFLEGLEPD